MVPAFEALVTYEIKLADIACDAEIANDAVYNDPDPKGYTLNILTLVL